MPLSTPIKQPGKARSVLLYFALLTIVVIIAQTWWAIAEDRQQTLAAEKGNGLVAVRLLEEHAAQTLRDAERKLDTISIVIAAANQQDGEIGIRRVITQSVQSNRFLLPLQFINPKGEIWDASATHPTIHADNAKRRYIQLLLDNPTQREAQIATPFQRVHDKQLVVPMARILRANDGRTLGILSTDIDINYFTSVYARVANNTSHALVSLFANAGFVVVRAPFDARYLDLDISESSIFKEIQVGPPEGHIEGLSFWNYKQSTSLLYTYRKLNSFPLTAVFAREVDSILADFHRRTMHRLIFSGSTILLIGILVFLLLRHVRRLRTTEASLRDSETKFVLLFQRSPVPLALIRFDQDIFVEANTALLAQFGYTREEFIGKSPFTLRLWENYGERQPYLDLLKLQSYVDRHEVTFRSKSGHIFTCLLSSRLFESGGLPMAIFSPIDVTHQREIEDEIRQFNSQLERRVRQRTLKLEQANQELAEALGSVKNMQSELFRSERMAALGSLVAGIAHELSTPIGNSVTVASTLQGQAQSVLNDVRAGNLRRSALDQHLEASAKGAEILVRNLNRAAELVSGFKQVAVDQASSQRRNFDLAQMLGEVVITLEPMYKKKPYKLQLALAADIPMLSYPGALGQIITNFISNALAHAFEGRNYGTMYLATRLLNELEVEIKFSDDGIGIEEQNLKRIFDPFFTTKLGRGGSGLGMHIVYNLVTGVLGGKITLESKPGEGTSFVLVLPLDTPEEGK